MAVVEVGLLAALLDDLREARAARAAWMDEEGAAAAGEAAGFPAPGQVPGWRKFKLWREKKIFSAVPPFSFHLFPLILPFRVHFNRAFEAFEATENPLFKGKECLVLF